MDSDQIARLAYLVLLGAVIGGSFLIANRREMGKVLQQAAIWALIFIGVVAAYGLWSDIRNDVAPVQATLSDGSIEVPMGRDGHFHLTLEVNGAPIKFVVDTGATDIVLTEEDARRAGLNPDELAYLGTAFTANGPVRIAPVRLDSLRLGPITDRNVRAVVNEGELFQSLLGMAYLNRFDIQMSAERLRLSR